MRLQITIDTLERLMRQPCTPDVEHSKCIIVMVLMLLCIGKVYVSIKSSEDKNDAYGRFRNHLEGEWAQLDRIDAVEQQLVDLELVLLRVVHLD